MSCLDNQYNYTDECPTIYQGCCAVNPCDFDGCPHFAAAASSVLSEASTTIALVTSSVSSSIGSTTTSTTVSTTLSSSSQAPTVVSTASTFSTSTLSSSSLSSMTSSLSSSITSTPTSSTSSSTTSAAPAATTSSSSSSSSDNTGTIVGAVVGVVAAITIIVLGFICFRRRKAKKIAAARAQRMRQAEAARAPEEAQGGDGAGAGTGHGIDGSVGGGGEMSMTGGEVAAVAAGVGAGAAAAAASGPRHDEVLKEKWKAQKSSPNGRNLDHDNHLYVFGAKIGHFYNPNAPPEIREKPVRRKSQDNGVYLFGTNIGYFWKPPPLPEKKNNSQAANGVTSAVETTDAERNAAENRTSQRLSMLNADRDLERGEGEIGGVPVYNPFLESPPLDNHASHPEEDPVSPNSIPQNPFEEADTTDPWNRTQHPDRGRDLTSRYSTVDAPPHNYSSYNPHADASVSLSTSNLPPPSRHSNPNSPTHAQSSYSPLQSGHAGPSPFTRSSTFGGPYATIPEHSEVRYDGHSYGSPGQNSENTAGHSLSNMASSICSLPAMAGSSPTRSQSYRPYRPARPAQPWGEGEGSANI